MTVLAAAASGLGALDPSRTVIPLDQDLIFGRAVRDSVRIYSGIPFKLEAHLARLSRSASSLGLPPPVHEELRELVEQILDRRLGTDYVIRIYWSSGRALGELGPPHGIGPGRAIALAVPIPEHLDELRKRGVRLISLESGSNGVVRGRSPWLLPGAKPTGSASSSAAWREALARGADDAVMVDVEGRPLEGPGTSIWWRHGTTLRTPSLRLGILPGITRATVAELAPSFGYEVREGDYALEDLASADEAFVTSTVAEVVGVVELDGEPIGDGWVGEASHLLLRELRKLASPGG